MSRPLRYNRWWSRTKDALVILTVVGLAALFIYGFWLSYEQCLEDGYNVTECRALLGGNGHVAVGRGR